MKNPKKKEDKIINFPRNLSQLEKQIEARRDIYNNNRILKKV